MSNILTPREQQVWDLVSKRMTAKRIALELGISHRTVEKHKAKAVEKLRNQGLLERRCNR